MSATDILNRLKSGNDRFQSDNLEHKLQDQHRRSALTEGQQPPTIVLSCADSRVVPEHAFDAGLGELFVIRVAGNIDNTESIASIEYAVANCGSKLIVVLGHEECGAVKAAMANAKVSSHIDQLLAHINPAIAEAGNGAATKDVVIKNAEMVAKRLVEKSDIISKAVQSGDVEIKPAYYQLSNGAVNFL